MKRKISHVFYLTFFLAQLLNNAVSGIQRHDCDFPDENMFLPKRSVVPKFGKSPTVVKFDSEEKVKQFVEDASKIYHEIVQGNLYNSIDPFIQFYKDSLETYNQEPELLMGFFLKYQYKFRPKENGLSMAIELLNQISAMKEKYPEVENKGFLASAPSTFTKYAIKHLAIKDNVTLQSRIHSKKLINAVAVYKIQVGEKIVFVIFNTVYYFDKPIVLVQDYPEDPLNSNIGESRSNKYVHRFFKEVSSDYILVDVYGKDKPDELVCSEIIYTGESYCSFMETTDKRYLVYPLKGLFKQGKGQELSGLLVHLEVIAHGHPAELYTYLFAKQNESSNVINEQNFPINTAASGSFDQDLIDIRKLRLTKVAEALGLKYEDVISKLTALREILANHGYIQSVAELNNILFQDKPELIEENWDIIEAEIKKDLAKKKQ